MADTPRLVTTLRHRLGDGPESVVIWDTVEITVGRHPAQDLVVPDGDVSREHAVFRREGASFVVEDCNTALGTRVNGTRVRSAALDPGDVIEVGRLRVEFHQTHEVLRVGGDVRYASELKAQTPAPRGPGDRTMLGLELDDDFAPRSPSGEAAPAAGPRALSDDGALEDVPEIGADLALPPEELEAWCTAAGAARDLDAELGVAGADVAAARPNGGAAPAGERAALPDDDDPNARTVRDGGALAAAALAVAPAAARAGAAGATPVETAVELALEVRGPEAAVQGLLALLASGELPVGPLRLRLRDGSAARPGALRTPSTLRAQSR